MNKKLKTFVLFCIGATIITLSVVVRQNEREDIRKHQVSIKAKVVRVGIKTIKVMYNVEGMDYFYTEGIPHVDISVSEEFHGIANANNRDRAIIYYNRPVVDTMEYQYITTKLLDLDMPWYTKRYVEFSYFANGKKYNRIQRVRNNNKVSTDIERYLVKYRVGNPEIAYVVPLE